jgi:two-component system sensor histidine kinase KdpD
VSFRLNLGLATTGFTYLVVVVVAAICSGFWIASAASATAVLCLNYFFVAPILTFRVAAASDLIALWAFEFTALVVSQLSHLASRRAAQAAAERRDSERLYDVSRRILLFNAASPPAHLLTTAIREVFELDGVILLDSSTAFIHRAGLPPENAEERTRSVYLMDRSDFDPATRSWYCALRLESKPVGALALCGGEVSNLAANALASLCSAALERALSLERECRAEAARQSEQLRAAVLDALGHEFKTPLAAIWTASSALLEIGGMSDMQRELVTLIDEQTTKLNALTTRLITTARLDRGDFHPALEPMFCSKIARSLVGKIDSIEAATRIQIEPTSREVPALADPKLIAASLTQLIDNALKYSAPGSQIRIRFSSTVANSIVSVHSRGVVIQPSERERIFERFYRAQSGADSPPGTGLGLSIVRRIVECHAGRVWVESDSQSGTEFFLALPIARVATGPALTCVLSPS